jgi:hypothetical protein
MLLSSLQSTAYKDLIVASSRLAMVDSLLLQAPRNMTASCNNKNTTVVAFLALQHQRYAHHCCLLQCKLVCHHHLDWQHVKNLIVAW